MGAQHRGGAGIYLLGPIAPWRTHLCIFHVPLPTAGSAVLGHSRGDAGMDKICVGNSLSGFCFHSFKTKLSLSMEKEGTVHAETHLSTSESAGPRPLAPPLALQGVSSASRAPLEEGVASVETAHLDGTSDRAPPGSGLMGPAPPRPCTPTTLCPHCPAPPPCSYILGSGPGQGQGIGRWFWQEPL